MPLVCEDERQFPVRRYQNRNLRDLDFTVSSDVAEFSEPALLPYFTKTNKYCTSAVLEESVIDNEVLKQTPFFKFDPRFIEELLKVEGCTRAVVVLPDMQVSHQGDQADSLVVIVRGQVETYVDGVFQRRLCEGDYFGEREFLGVSNERAATAIAVTFCDARIMYRRGLSKILARCPAMREDYSFLISFWNRKSERDALRLLKAFTERCMDCLDKPDPSEKDSSTDDAQKRSSPRSQNVQRGGQTSKSTTSDLSATRGVQSSNGSGFILLSTRGSKSFRKVGEASLKVGRAVRFP
mmetsp:Transcript_96655/g.152939  ORF Transcript_96655/g.152939 Transcript_96655/m.152939 type:complete len:295 (-) Transcript_96655:28-912(-)